MLLRWNATAKYYVGPIPWISHRTNSSILKELHLPTYWLYNFVRRQKLKYFGHVTRHNALEKMIMQGMVAGKICRGDPRQRWEKYITDTSGTMTTASRVARTGRHQFRIGIWAATSWQGYRAYAEKKKIRRQWSFTYVICVLSFEYNYVHSTSHSPNICFAERPHSQQLPHSPSSMALSWSVRIYSVVSPQLPSPPSTIV